MDSRFFSKYLKWKPSEQFGEKSRESKWTESIAVGSKGFVERTKVFLWIKVKGIKVMNRSGGYELRGPAASYNLHFDSKTVVLRPENTSFWRD